MVYAVATWNASVSADVVVQEFSWIVNGTVQKVVLLPPDAVTRSTTADGVAIVENDEVCFSVTARDQFSSSTAASACKTLPLVPPEPPTNLAVDFVEEI